MVTLPPIPSRWISRRGLAAAGVGLLVLAEMMAGPLGAADEATVAPPAAPWQPSEDWRSLLQVDPEMRAFFDARVSRATDEVGRLQMLFRAIVGRDGLGFTYEGSGVYDAREAFRRRRGNCQSFGFLLVAVAREYGLRARFQDMETAMRWNRFGYYVAAVRHTNVLVGTTYANYVVDLRPDLARPTTNDTTYVVEDARAIAQFYSTAGFFRLVAGDAAAAVHLTELGSQLDPSAGIVWANLGCMYAQLGSLPEARRSFERALKLNSDEEGALTGLVDVLRRIGGPNELKQAAKYERRAQRCRDRNPYYAYAQAGEAAEAGDLAAAEQQLRRAIRLKRDDPLFHDELARLLHRQGRTADAARVEAQAAKVRASLVAAAVPLVQ